jgi:hypothetical protein
LDPEHTKIHARSSTREARGDNVPPEQRQPSYVFSHLHEQFTAGRPHARHGDKIWIAG